MNVKLELFLSVELQKRGEENHLKFAIEKIEIRLHV